MKKSIKVISTLLLAIMLVASIATTAFAAVNLNTTISNIENQNLNGNADSQITKVGGNIVIAVIVLLVIGIKYMIGSASEKAEYKKTMIPYVVGAVLVFAGTSLVKVIYSLATAVK